MIEKFENCIKNIFKHSEKIQPNKYINIATSVVDLFALLLSIYLYNPLIALIVIPTAEIITFTKNFYDTNIASKLRNIDISYLKYIKESIIQKLKTSKIENDDEQKFIYETNKLFSDIEYKSKAGLTTILSYRIIGFVGSATIILTGLILLKPVLIWVINIINSFELAQPIQLQHYPVNLLSNIIKIIIGSISYLASSYYLSANLLEPTYKKLRTNTITWKREIEEEKLKERAEELLKKIINNNEYIIYI